MNAHPEVEITVVTDHKCQVGDSPVWDAVGRRLYWVDSLRAAVHQFDPESGRLHTFQVGEIIGSIALRERGGIVAALASGFAFLDIEAENVEHIHDPEAGLPGNRFAGGACDAEGRFWAGTTSVTDSRGAGTLYMLQRDGRAQRRLTGISNPRGLAWSTDNKRLYFLDTPTFEVIAFDYHAASGVIHNPRIALQIAPDMGAPGGIAIDADGMLWIAHWDGGQLSRWDPLKAKLLNKILLPVSRLTGCTFGGGGLNEILVSTARTGLSEQAIADQPLAGSLFRIRYSGAIGLPANKYGG